ncbi:GH92 family glycosyl hydrolase [Terrabacter sp. 2YAF2]|uniref:GH92 family glycosyl hydrolase n=1 Tax=Terrabacter sp. 2YAF2 TaxID=3233026 RepID=UPI003F9D4695
MSKRTGIQRGVIALAVLATATVGAIAGPAQAGALGGTAGAPRSAPAAAAGAGDFSTSFETGQPQPELSTVEVGAHGPRQQNVSGTASADGSLLGSVVGVTASAENTPGEVASNLADANPDSKWLAFASAGWVRYQLGTPAKALRYSLTSANDSPERDPKDFTLQGSSDGTTWTDLDRRTGIDFSGRFAKRTFDVTTPATYAYYRLDVTAVHSGGIVQLADWDLSDGSTGSGPATPMKTVVGSGPISGFNIKPLVGWTGVKALRYSGGHTADGRGYAWNRLFDVDLPVTAQTRLSYKIFPDMIAGDLEYPSTYAALDVRFTDGTYLSDLGADDQHGVAASPSGQGKGKILYANQWNAVSLDVGKVAAGKTIDRVLVGYDNTGGATKDTRFGGWIDDVSVQAKSAVIDGADLTNYVDVRRGTNASSSFSRGNNLPISALPNGFTFFTPVTNATSQSWEYYYQSANNAANLPVLQGLAVSHEPSPWMGDRNQMSVMPSVATGTPTGSASGRGLAFDHATEVAHPDYYKVALAGGLTAETAPADHGGVYRFTFPASAVKGHLVVDTIDDNGTFAVDAASGTMTGWVDNGSGLSAGRSRMFVYGTFDRPATAVGTAPNGHTGTRYATFDTTTDKQVTLKLSTSFISLDQAKKNHALELASRDFDAVRAAAKEAWNARLGVVSVKGANDSERTTLYSNLYRLNLYPNSQFENTGTAAAPRYQYASPVAAKSGSATATTTNAAVKDGRIYVNNGFWDTYRTVWPAYSLLYPEVAAEIADGFVQQYRDGGWVARWSSPGYADLMTGTSSDVAFADAYAKGVKLPDPLAAYDAAVKNATVLPTSSAVGRKGLDTSTFLGYTSTNTGESVSWGLEGLVNDFGIGTMAAKLAKDPATPEARRAQLTEESKYFLERATHYGNLFNPKVGFFQGRAADGTFPSSFDPEAWGGDYTETNAWNFAFHAPFDGNGLANLYGGRDALAKKLDTFFATPETATKPGGYGGVIHEMLEARDVRMGMLGQSNQVSHHIAYMYDWTGQQWKTAEKVREIMRRLYVGGEIGQGYPGDEDNGEMSAWYVLSSLGIYPLQVGSANWAIGSPKFEQVRVKRTQGDLVVNAPGNSETNIYVQGVTVNGAKHKSVSISQDEIAGPTTVDFAMGAKPSDFGSRAQDAPPSLTQGTEAPNPLKDATGPGRGTATATDLASGDDAKALFDNTSRTSVAFTSATPSVTFALSGVGQRATWYTVTSGPKAGDPSAWRLEGSKDDGKTWQTLDTRTAQTFPWRVQTRPFEIAHTGTFTTYRLVVTATAGGAAPNLSELELLTDGSKAQHTGLKVSAAEPFEVAEDTAWSGTVATFSGGVAKGTDASSATATIAWGDGSTSAGTIEAGDLGSSTVRGSHTYADPGPYQPKVSVTLGKETASTLGSATVHQASTPAYAAGFDSVCFGNVGDSVPCDGDRAGLSREALVAAGGVPGKLLSVPGTDLRFSMPGIPVGTKDNATGAGQTLPVTLAPGATKLSLIGTATQKNQDTTATVNFTDGSSTSYKVQYGDWCGSPQFGNVIAIQMAYRLNGTGTDGCQVKLFATAPLTVPAGKTVESVTLPTQTGDPKTAGRIHVFAVADNGSALEVAAGADTTAKAGADTDVTLGTAKGGVPASTGYTARVQWGDGTVTEDAAVTTASDGSATVEGGHAWAAAGTYTVRVLVSDSRSDVLASLKVTVG